MTNNQCARKWVFTLNNPTDVEIESLKAFAESRCKYACWGYEHYGERPQDAETWTPHLQGMIHLTTKNRRSWIINQLHTNRGCWLVQKGTDEQARDYCKKPEDTNSEK